MNEIRPIVQDYRRIVQDWTGLFLVLITRKHCEGLLYKCVLKVKVFYLNQENTLTLEILDKLLYLHIHTSLHSK